MFLLKWLNTGLNGSLVHDHRFVAIVAYFELLHHICSNPLVVLDHRLKISSRLISTAIRFQPMLFALLKVPNTSFGGIGGADLRCGQCRL